MSWKTSLLTIAGSLCMTIGIMLAACSGRDLSNGELRQIAAAQKQEGKCAEVKEKGTCGCYNQGEPPQQDYWMCGPSYVPNLVCTPIQNVCTPTGVYLCKNVPKCITDSDCKAEWCFPQSPCSGESKQCTSY
jgi:hypothetical protein